MKRACVEPYLQSDSFSVLFLSRASGHVYWNLSQSILNQYEWIKKTAVHKGFENEHLWLHEGIVEYVL